MAKRSKDRTPEGICLHCYNVGTVLIEPEQIGYCRRRDWEERSPPGSRVYESPEGVAELLSGTFNFRVPCPWCRPRRRQYMPTPLFTQVFGKRPLDDNDA